MSSKASINKIVKMPDPDKAGGALAFNDVKLARIGRETNHVEFRAAKVEFANRGTAKFFEMYRLTMSW